MFMAGRMKTAICVLVLAAASAVSGLGCQEPWDERTYSITLPLYDNSGESINQTVYDGFARKLSEHFGGVSVQPSSAGCWYDKEREKLDCEKNIIFNSSRDCSDTTDCREVIEKQDRPFIKSIAEEYAKMLGQSCVYVRETVGPVTLFTGKWKEKVSPDLRGQGEIKYGKNN